MVIDGDKQIPAIFMEIDDDNTGSPAINRIESQFSLRASPMSPAPAAILGGKAIN